MAEFEIVKWDEIGRWVVDTRESTPEPVIKKLFHLLQGISTIVPHYRIPSDKVILLRYTVAI
jgi:hypothetical protein